MTDACHGRRFRRTHCTVEPTRPLRHPATAHHEVGELLGLFRGEWPRHHHDHAGD